MRPLSAGELSAMQHARGETMMDECTILQRVAGAEDAHGRPIETWAELGPYACGFHKDLGSDKEAMGDAQVPTFSAFFRLPAGVQVTNLDRIKLTKRYGSNLATPQEYQVVSTANAGPSGIVVAVREL